MKLLQGSMRRISSQLTKVFLPKLRPLHRMCVIPLAQFVRRSDVFHPHIERRVVLREPSWPQPVHQHARSVLRRRRVVHAFDSDRHTGCILTPSQSYHRPALASSADLTRKVGLISKLSVRCALFVLIAAILTALSGCDAEPRKTDAELGLNAQQIRGRRIYDARCAECHYAYSSRNLRGPSLHGLFKKQYMTSGIPANDERVIDII